MLDFSEARSTTSSSGVATFRLTMSPTTPGCGMNAMSGVSFAWILVMMSWLMLPTRDHLTVMPACWANGSRPFCRPSMITWSRLVQIVTVDPLACPEGVPPPLVLLPPPLRHAVVMAMVTPRTAAVLNRVGARMGAPHSSDGSGRVPNGAPDDAEAMDRVLDRGQRIEPVP